MPLYKNTHGTGGNGIKKRSSFLNIAMIVREKIHPQEINPNYSNTSLEACLIISCSSNHDFRKDHWSRFCKTQTWQNSYVSPGWIKHSGKVLFVLAYTSNQNGRHFSILLFPCKLALMASFKVKYSFEFFL